MKKKSWHLSRRMFLGGAAATVALPYLEAMIPTAGPRATGKVKAQTDSPVRLAFIWVPNGMIRTNITPREAGRGYTMPRLLSPIADLRNDFSVLTGISNKPGAGSYTYPDGTVSSDGPGDHARDTGTFLTCARLRKTSGTDIRNGISIDQVAANALREITPEIPSLELATKDGSYGGDSGYAPIYKSNISWANETTPMPKETSPRAVFERLFAGVDPGATAAEIDRRQRLDQSVLDYCLDDVHRLERLLGTQDQRRLDEYLTGVRHLEVRLDALGGGALACDPGSPPTDPGDFRARVELFWDVVTLAFQCDRTRVMSMMLMKPDNVYDFLGISGSHHNISHLDGGGTDVRQIEAINEWQISAFGDFLRKLQAVTEADGATLLDNSLVLFGGGLDATGHRDDSLTPQPSGPVHRHTDLPLFLGGRGGGYHDAGRNIVYTRDEPLADLYIAMCHAAGVMVDRFALEGTGPIDQLG